MSYSRRPKRPIKLVTSTRQQGRRTTKLTVFTTLDKTLNKRKRERTSQGTRQDVPLVRPFLSILTVSCEAIFFVAISLLAFLPVFVACFSRRHKFPDRYETSDILNRTQQDFTGFHNTLRKYKKCVSVRMSMRIKTRNKNYKNTKHLKHYKDNTYIIIIIVIFCH